MSKDLAKPRHLPLYVGYREVQDALSVSRRTVERMVRDKKFPHPEQLSPNRVGWKVEMVKAWLDERGNGLAAHAVVNPDDLAPDQLADAAVDLLTRAVEHELGQTIDPRGLRVSYGPPSSPVTVEAFAEAEAAELTLWQHRFAEFELARAYVMAALLFPALRQTFADGAADDGFRQLFLDEQALYDLALSAMNDDSWEHGLVALKARSNPKA